MNFMFCRMMKFKWAMSDRNNEKKQTEWRELACGGMQSVDPMRPNERLGKLNLKMVLTVLKWAMSDRPNEKAN